MIPNRIPLEEVLELLGRYGRPTLHQYAASATPGHAAAGEWSCEVWVTSRWPEASEDERKDQVNCPVTGWRLIGRNADPHAAAMQCLERCIGLAEGPGARHAKFETKADVLAAEAKRLSAYRPIIPESQA